MANNPVSPEVYFNKNDINLVKDLLQKPTVDNLIATVLKISKSEPAVSGDSRNDLPLLRQILRDRYEKDDHRKTLIERICEAALQADILFPTGAPRSLKQGVESEIILTRAQVLGLLANLFLGTVNNATPNRNFSILDWLQQDLSSPLASCCNLYINSLLNYFDDKLVQNELITYKRHVLTESLTWDKLDIPLISNINIHISGKIGDETGDVQVDFANKYVGPGSGGTQEELLLGTHPETIPICLFSEPLLDNEAISMIGARQYGTFTGYGFDTKYEGPYTGVKNWQESQIIAIDAICYRAPSAGECRIQQLRKEDLMRELNKAHIGFQVARQQSLATGHWGCGAFQGDKEIKCLIQLMAASAAGVSRMNFYCFGDKEFHDGFVQMVEVIRDKKIRVCDAWNILTTAAPKNPNSMKEKYEPTPYLFKHFNQLRE